VVNGANGTNGRVANRNGAAKDRTGARAKATGSS
jgi:hypothetical protein